MRRYFTFTFSALSRGLERLKTQLSSPPSSEFAHAAAHPETSIAPVTQTNAPSIQKNPQAEPSPEITPGTEAVADNEDLVRGVRYLQNYSAVKLQEIVSRVMAEVSSGQDEHFKNASNLSMLEAAKQQTKDYQTWWLQDLIAKVAVSEGLRATPQNSATNSTSSFMPLNVTSSSSTLSNLGSGHNSGVSSGVNVNSMSTMSSFSAERIFDADESTNREAARKLMLELFTNFKSLTAEFNSIIAKMPEFSKLRISTTEISSVREKDSTTFWRCRT